MKTKERLLYILSHRIRGKEDIAATSLCGQLIKRAGKNNQADLLRTYYIGMYYIIGMEPGDFGPHINFKEQYSLEEYEQFKSIYGNKITLFFDSLANIQLNVNEFYHEIWEYLSNPNHFEHARDRNMAMFYISRHNSEMLLDITVEDFIGNHHEEDAFADELEEYLDLMPDNRQTVNEVKSTVEDYDYLCLYKKLRDCKELLTREEWEQLLKAYKEKLNCDEDWGEYSDSIGGEEPKYAYPNLMQDEMKNPQNKKGGTSVFYWRNDPTKPIYSLHGLFEYRYLPDFDLALNIYLNNMSNERESVDEILDVINCVDQFYPQLYEKLLGDVDRQLMTESEYRKLREQFTEVMGNAPFVESFLNDS